MTSNQRDALGVAAMALAVGLALAVGISKLVVPHEKPKVALAAPEATPAPKPSPTPEVYPQVIESTDCVWASNEKTYIARAVGENKSRCWLETECVRDKYDPDKWVSPVPVGTVAACLWWK